MPVLENDSLIVSAVGYQKTHITIPQGEGESYTTIIALKADTTLLPALEIRGYPTEEQFKEAILAMRLPYQGQYKNMQQNLDQAILNKMYKNLPIGAAGNHNYFINQQRAAYDRRFQANSMPLLNPFAWREFIKSLKRGNQKRKKPKKGKKPPFGK